MGSAMAVIEISADKLRQNADEGIVLTNCGGNLQEWLDGINNQFAEAGIFRNGSRFESCYAFEDYGYTNLMFPTDGLDINTDKLDEWVQATHHRLGTEMLSDYYESEPTAEESEDIGINFS